MKNFIIVLAFAALVACTPIAEDHKLIGGQRDEYGCLGPAGYSFDKDVNACVRSWELDDSQKRAAAIAVEDYGAKEGTTVVEVLTLRCPGCFTVKLERYGVTEEIGIIDWKIEQPLVPPEPFDTGEDRAIILAEDYVTTHLPHARDFTITKVEQLKCPGCFDISAYYKSAPAFNATYSRWLLHIPIRNWEVGEVGTAMESVFELSPEECLNKGGRNVNIVGGASCDEGEVKIGEVVGFISPNICCAPQ